MAKYDFDATDVPPRGEFEPLPAGEYLCVIIDSEMKKTKDGRGQYLELCFEVVDGKHKGRYLWDRLNLDNVSGKAVEIARQTLSSICHAVGKLSIKDSEQLHNIPLTVKVRVREYMGENRNEIVGYEGSRSEPAKLAPASKPKVEKALGEAQYEDEIPF